MVLLRRTTIRVAAACIGSIALASLIWAAFEGNSISQSAYFLPQFRVWELLAGSLCAFWLRSREPRPSEWLGWLGFALIIFAVPMNIPNRAVSIVLAVIGTSFIVLYAPHGTTLARLLSMPPMVLLGLASYGAYLWHQPMLVFARAMKVGALSIPESLFVFVISVCAGWVSWRYIERPFRRGHRSRPGGKKQLFVLGAVGSGLFVVLLAFWWTKGLPQRFEPHAIAAYREATDPFRDGKQCAVSNVDPKGRICIEGEKATYRRSIALFGDSSAAQWIDALDPLASERGWQIVILTRNGCTVADIGADDCGAWREHSWRTIEQEEFDLVVITQASRKAARRFYAGSEKEWSRALETLAARLDRSGRNWAIHSSGPAYFDLEPQDCYFQAKFLGSRNMNECRESADTALDPVVDDDVRSLAAKSERGHFIDMTREFCPANQCRAEIDDVLLMSDRAHVSRDGAEFFAPVLMHKIEEVLGD